MSESLKQQWTRVNDLTRKLQLVSTTEEATEEEMNAYWQERETILHSILSEYQMSLLSSEDLIWLQDKVTELQNQDRALLETLKNDQIVIRANLKKEIHKSSAAKAYRQQQ